MSKLFQRIIGTAALVVVLSSVDAQAQGQRGPGGGGGQRGPGGGFDREAMMERMMERAQEGLGFSDAEWKIVSPMLVEVTELQGNNRGGGGIFALGRLGAPDDGQGGPGGGRGGRGGRGGFFGEPDPAEAALAEAIASGASADVLKEKMSTLRKKREAEAKKLATSQEKLRGVLSVEQEAKLVMAGILP